MELLALFAVGRRAVPLSVLLRCSVSLDAGLPVARFRKLRAPLGTVYGLVLLDKAGNVAPLGLRRMP